MRSILEETNKGRYFAILCVQEYYVHEQDLLDNAQRNQEKNANFDLGKNSVVGRLCENMKKDKNPHGVPLRRNMNNYISYCMGRIIPPKKDGKLFEIQKKGHKDPYEEMLLIKNSAEILLNLDFNSQKNANVNPFIKKLKADSEKMVGELKIIDQQKRQEIRKKFAII